MESNSLIENIVNQYYQNGDILSIEKNYKQITIKIAEKEEKYFLYDEKFSIEIKFSQKERNMIESYKEVNKEIVPITMIQINKYDLDTIVCQNELEEVKYHVILIPEDYEMKYKPLKKYDLPLNIDNDEIVYIKMYEIKNNFIKNNIYKQCLDNYIHYQKELISKIIHEKNNVSKGFNAIFSSQCTMLNEEITSSQNKLEYEKSPTKSMSIEKQQEFTIEKVFHREIFSIKDISRLKYLEQISEQEINNIYQNKGGLRTNTSNEMIEPECISPQKKIKEIEFNIRNDMNKVNEVKYFLESIHSRDYHNINEFGTLSKIEKKADNKVISFNKCRQNKR